MRGQAVQNYHLRVMDVRGGQQEVLLVVVARALDDDEALRAAHAVADMAERGGARGGAGNACVAVTASDGREVGFVGTCDADAHQLDRPETKAATYEPPSS